MNSKLEQTGVINAGFEQEVATVRPKTRNQLPPDRIFKNLDAWMKLFWLVFSSFGPKSLGYNPNSETVFQAIQKAVENPGLLFNVTIKKGIQSRLAELLRSEWRPIKCLNEIVTKEGREKEFNPTEWNIKVTYELLRVRENSGCTYSEIMAELEKYHLVYDHRTGRNISIIDSDDVTAILLFLEGAGLAAKKDESWVLSHWT